MGSAAALQVRLIFINVNTEDTFDSSRFSRNSRLVEAPAAAPRLSSSAWLWPRPPICLKVLEALPLEASRMPSMALL